MQLLDMIAYRLFGKKALKAIEGKKDLIVNLRKARMPITADMFLSIGYFYSFIGGFVTGLAGLLIGLKYMGDLRFSYIIGNYWFTPYADEVLTLIIALMFFFAMAFAINLIYMQIPSFTVSLRKSHIDQSLPHGSAYLYALSRGGGLNIYEMFSSLSQQSHVYGAMSDEFGYVVRDMEYFGMDMLTAIRNAGNYTPSDQLKIFFDGLISVISSGGDLTSYLHSKTEQYRFSAGRNQKIFLETLGVFAEVYVAVFVVGPIFMMIILVVLGFLGSGSGPILYVLIYALIPLGTLFYLVLLSTLSGDVKNKEISVTQKRLHVFEDVRLKQESLDEVALLKRTERYEKINKIRNSLLHPFEFMEKKPYYALFISIPFGLIYLIYSIGSVIYVPSDIKLTALKLHNMDIGIATIVDDYIFIAFMIVMVPFIIFYEIRSRRIRRIEDEIPDFLKRLASINEAGILLVDAIGMVAKANIGVLHSEVKRMKESLSWGTDLALVLRKFEYRIRTEMNSRIITLIIKASESTSDIISVLNIAAGDAELHHNLKKERSSEMVVYVFIVYISFTVFLFIVYVLMAYFLPSIPASTGDMAVGMPMNIDFDIDEYIMLFFHASLIQGLCSGLVAGQMGNGSIPAGLKHSVIMMLVAYIAFVFLI